MFWVWGLLGAIVFAANSLILSLWAQGQTASGRGRAVAEFAAALVTGAVFAQGFTPTLQSVAMKFVATDPVAVALTIGWSSNYLWPRLLRRLGQKVDRIIREGP